MEFEQFKSIIDQYPLKILYDSSCAKEYQYVNSDICRFLIVKFSKLPNKFDWCYFSAEQIFSVEKARTKLKYLKSRYIKEIKAFKEFQQNKRLSNLSEDFND